MLVSASGMSPNDADRDIRLHPSILTGRQRLSWKWWFNSTSGHF